MANELTRRFVFALNAGETLEQARATARFYGLNPDWLVQCEGVYKGELEVSYSYPMVKFSHDLALLWRLCRNFKQESILAVTHDDVAALCFADGSRSILGWMKPCTAGEAQRAHAYTKVGDNYYTTFE